jgi:thiol-disulfide isomerase/thioredoxin
MILTAFLLSSATLEKAPEFRSADVWINVDRPLKLSALRGKVVLIDFWAFDCDPCKETIPRIEALHDKYAKDGLVVIGVHTPRADYEKDVAKLREAIKGMGIQYPVVVDNKERIWDDYRCDLWPTQFVVDRKGFIRLSTRRHKTISGHRRRRARSTRCILIEKFQKTLRPSAREAFYTLASILSQLMKRLAKRKTNAKNL